MAETARLRLMVTEHFRSQARNGAFATRANDLRLGWGCFPDGEAGVVYLYDKGDGGFGCARNLDWDDGSEWGDAPFG
jgi:hypothetical protein